MRGHAPIISGGKSLPWKLLEFGRFLSQRQIVGYALEIAARLVLVDADRLEKQSFASHLDIPSGWSQAQPHLRAWVLTLSEDHFAITSTNYVVWDLVRGTGKDLGPPLLAKATAKAIHGCPQQVVSSLAAKEVVQRRADATQTEQKQKTLGVKGHHGFHPSSRGIV